MRANSSRQGRRLSDAADEIELESMTGKSWSPRPQLVALASPATRNGFVRKVYGILAAQLLATTIIAGMFVRQGRGWLKVNPPVVLAAVSISCFVSMGISFICVCCPDVMRRCPLNYGLIAAFTIAESLIIGFVCLKYTAGSVLLCLGLTVVVVFGLTLYAFVTKSDITAFGPYLFCTLLVMCATGVMMWSIAALGLTHNPLFSWMQILYAIAGAFVFSIFIVHDTQKIVGGHHEQEFSVDDYALAAMCLYLDIIQLFLSLLRLLGRDDEGL